jgi:hypothetical protein
VPRLSQARLRPIKCIRPCIYRTRPELSVRRPAATRCLRCEGSSFRGKAGLRQCLREAIARQKRIETLRYAGHVHHLCEQIRSIVMVPLPSQINVWDAAVKRDASSSLMAEGVKRAFYALCRP